MAEVLGIDAGNNEVKTAGIFGVDRFLSQFGEYRELNLVNEHTRDDMVFEYNGRKGFAGTLAEESEYGGSVMGESKAHEDTLIRVLLSLHRNATDNNVKLIVGQPIGTHSNDEKKRIKEMLQGRHTITINGKTRTFIIERVEVAAEGGSAFWSAPVNGLIRIIDIGSGTVNCGSLRNKKYSDKDSFTLPFGMNTTKSTDFKAMARGIYTQTSKKWKSNDVVLVCGGGAEVLYDELQTYYPNARLLQPILGNRIYETIYANAIGFYNIGRATYGN